MRDVNDTILPNISRISLRPVWWEGHIQLDQCTPASVTQQFDGKIDEVRLWENSHPFGLFVNNQFTPLSGNEQGLVASMANG